MGHKLMTPEKRLRMTADNVEAYNAQQKQMQARAKAGCYVKCQDSRRNVVNNLQQSVKTNCRGESLTEATLAASQAPAGPCILLDMHRLSHGEKPLQAFIFWPWIALDALCRKYCSVSYHGCSVESIVPPACGEECTTDGIHYNNATFDASVRCRCFARPFK